MSQSRKASVVDGYTALTAARRAIEKGDRHEPAAARPAPKKKPAASTPAAAKEKAAFAHTALPTKQEICCYDCGYVFAVAGLSEKIVCPKCRALLDRTDKTIDADWNEVLKTVGTVRIAAGGVIRGGVVQGNRVILEGKVLDGTVQANEELELRAGAEFQERLVRARDLLIAAGATFTLASKAYCRNMEVRGTLEAAVYAEGTVTVRPEGVLRGEVHTAHLRVEDGARLEAAVFLESDFRLENHLRFENEKAKESA